ncbi:hypothetical protein M0R45_013877 [Rubus argutus]|uniref:VWFA domain-containing protein n=1 Tax=Rubus argutus TaxID=59490 RepID=A0AAW1XLG7_RUBAR
MSVDGRESAILAVESLRACGGTDIAAGLEKATRIFEDRRERNPVSSIILLSDGQDNYCRSGSQMLKKLPASIRSRNKQDEVPVHTFGFGTDHDANIMHAIFDEGLQGVVDVGNLDLASKQLIQVVGERVEIARPEVCSPADQVVSLEVDRQRNRVSVAEAIAEAQGLAEMGNLEGARAILTQRRETLLATPAARAGDGLSSLLETELREITDRMATMDLYAQTGRAHALSGMSSHSLQRATTRGDTTTSCLSAVPSYSSGGINCVTFEQQQAQPQCLSGGATPFASAAASPQVGAYETSSMVRMVHKSKNFGTSDQLY